MPAAKAFFEFAAGDNIGTGAETGESLQHCEVAVRFHRECNQRILRQRFGENAVVALERRGRIAVERRADIARERGQIDILGMQNAIAIPEMVHSPIGIGGRDGSF